MRGLLLKDCYTVVKQMKIMLIMMVVFACLPGYSLAAFAIIYGAMLPMVALAYDERSKWDQLAVMMPYSVKEIVISKYVFGILAIFTASVLSLTAQTVLGLIKGTGVQAGELISILAVTCVGILFLSLTMPVIFQMGVEKGRLVFMIMMFGIFFAVIALEDRLDIFVSRIKHPEFLFAGFLLFTCAVFFLSMPLSIAAYRKKNR